MKSNITALACSLTTFLILTPSYRADTLTNPAIDDIRINMNESKLKVCWYPGIHITTYEECKGYVDNASQAIQDSISSNLEDIQAEHDRLNENISNTTANTSSINTNTSAISSNDSDISTNATAISSNTSSINTNTSAISTNDADISSLKSLVKPTSSGIQIGTGTNPTTIHETGLEVGGENLIRRSADGAVHIGKNSLVTIEEGGRQKMWATNASGESIDIDITNGSRLLINGRDVEKSIDNVGALSAALGSVPAISADSPFTCGFGAGTHSSAYALSAGCASRVSDRVSVNAALATVINNHTGDKDDNLSARAGFTFKLGKIDDSPKVAARKAAALHDEVAALRDENESIKAASIEQKQLNLALMERLERLEAIALGQSPAIKKVSLK